jgi:hypothetical protein
VSRDEFESKVTQVHPEAPGALSRSSEAAIPGKQPRANIAEAPSLSIDDVSVSEGDAGTANATFTVILSQSIGETVTVDYATADNTAHAPDDYVAIPTTALTFAPHETSRQVTVLVNGDTLDEAEETFFVNLSNPVNATIADGQGIGTITDDDPEPALFSPPRGARLKRPPLLAWRAVRKADFYNVQLYRRGRKILSLWPHRPRLKLQWQWKYQQRVFRLRPAAYTWIVWPGFGPPAQGRFGPMLGRSTFRMVGRARRAR